MEDLVTAYKWRIEKTESLPQHVGPLAVRERAASIALMTRWGGFVWNTPLGIIIDDGRSAQTFRVIDYTRLLMLFLVGLSVTAVLLSQLVSQRIPVRCQSIEDENE